MEEYEYLATLGEGAYGLVYKCRKKATGRIVALKIFKEAHLEPEIRQLAMREVQMLKALDHPNVVSLLDAFQSTSGRIYMVFPYLGRSALQALYDHPDGLPPIDLKLLVWQLVQALSYLHERKVMHRDIKPANVLMTESSRVVLCDFGFARSARSDARGARPLSSYVITRWYRPPEVLLGREYGPAADIWSLGCTVAELASGLPLFQGNSTCDQLWRIMRCFGGLPPVQMASLTANPALRRLRAAPLNGRSLRQRLPPRCDPSLLEFLEACLHPDPTARRTAAELLQLPYFWSVTRMVKGTYLEQLYARAAAVAQRAAAPPPAAERALPTEQAAMARRELSAQQAAQELPGGQCGGVSVGTASAAAAGIAEAQVRDGMGDALGSGCMAAAGAAATAAARAPQAAESGKSAEPAPLPQQPPSDQESGAATVPASTPHSDRRREHHHHTEEEPAASDMGTALSSQSPGCRSVATRQSTCSMPVPVVASPPEAASYATSDSAADGNGRLHAHQAHDGDAQQQQQQGTEHLGEACVSLAAVQEGQAGRPGGASALEGSRGPPTLAAEGSRPGSCVVKAEDTADGAQPQPLGPPFPPGAAATAPPALCLVQPRAVAYDPIGARGAAAPSPGGSAPVPDALHSAKPPLSGPSPDGGGTTFIAIASGDGAGEDTATATATILSGWSMTNGTRAAWPSAALTGLSPPGPAPACPPVADAAARDGLLDTALARALLSTDGASEAPSTACSGLLAHCDTAAFELDVSSASVALARLRAGPPAPVVHRGGGGGSAGWDCQRACASGDSGTLAALIDAASGACEGDAPVDSGEFGLPSGDPRLPPRRAQTSSAVTAALVARAPTSSGSGFQHADAAAAAALRAASHSNTMAPWPAALAPGDPRAQAHAPRMLPPPGAELHIRPGQLARHHMQQQHVPAAAAQEQARRATHSNAFGLADLLKAPAADVAAARGLVIEPTALARRPSGSHTGLLCTSNLSALAETEPVGVGCSAGDGADATADAFWDEGPASEASNSSAGLPESGSAAKATVVAVPTRRGSRSNVHVGVGGALSPALLRTRSRFCSDHAPQPQPGGTREGRPSAVAAVARGVTDGSRAAVVFGADAGGGMGEQLPAPELLLAAASASLEQPPAGAAAAAAAKAAGAVGVYGDAPRANGAAAALRMPVATAPSAGARGGAAATHGSEQTADRERKGVLQKLLHRVKDVLAGSRDR